MAQDELSLSEVRLEKIVSRLETSDEELTIITEAIKEDNETTKDIKVGLVFFSFILINYTYYYFDKIVIVIMHFIYLHFILINMYCIVLFISILIFVYNWVNTM